MGNKPAKSKSTKTGAAKKRKNLIPAIEPTISEVVVQKIDFQSAAVGNPALWPFSTAKGPTEGWHRSKMPSRDGIIETRGDDYYLFPAYAEAGKLRLVSPKRDGSGLRCSGEGCEHAVEGCVHIWECRFRFGDLKDGNWDCPVAVMKRVKRKKGGVPYENVERFLPRPNPRVGKYKTATIMKHARLKMPKEFPKVLGDLACTLRREEAYKNRVAGKCRGRGRPEADIWDVALMAITRVHSRLSYEELAEEIADLSKPNETGSPILSQSFDHARVIEAMNGYIFMKTSDMVRRMEAEFRLTRALEVMRDRLLPLFRNVTTVVGCDGMVLSTAATDNARFGLKTRTRSAKVTLHVMYEMRWGIITAYRLTWHNRGRGSAESPQFPYLLKTTKQTMTETKVVLADMAFGSARNRAECLRKGVDLYCDIKDAQFLGKAALKYLTAEQILEEKRRCSVENPTYRQVYPFRNRVEGWHEVIRNQSERNLISQAELVYQPKTKDEQTKENPLRSDLNLPEDQVERDRIIASEQWVGRACHNEMLCRQIMTLVRAVVKAQEWYETRIDFGSPKAFQPRPEDQEFSIFRPRIDPQFVGLGGCD